MQQRDAETARQGLRLFVPRANSPSLRHLTRSFLLCLIFLIIPYRCIFFNYFTGKIFSSLPSGSSSTAMIRGSS